MQALADLRDSSEDGGKVVDLQSLVEQACNFYLAPGCFPGTYEEMQVPPVLKKERAFWLVHYLLPLFRL